MSAIDPAIVEAAQNAGPSCPECGHLIGAHSHGVGCMDSMSEGSLVRNQLGFCPCERSSLGLIAAAVDAARTEGDKLGAARVREAVEAIHRPEPDDGTTPFCHGCWEAGGYDGAPTWPCATIRALTEAAPHE